jgi:hypothetical protein
MDIKDMGHRVLQIVNGSGFTPAVEAAIRREEELMQMAAYLQAAGLEVPEPEWIEMAYHSYIAVEQAHAAMMGLANALEQTIFTPAMKQLLDDFTAEIEAIEAADQKRAHTRQIRPDPRMRRGRGGKQKWRLK